MLRCSDLFKYQLRAVRWIKEHMFCALWLDMGLGKSVITLTAIRELIDEFEVHKVLVAAPLRVANKTWPDELSEWEHLRDLRFSRIIGNEQERLAGLRREADIYLINRENLVWLVNQFFNGAKLKKGKIWIWDMLVLDESRSYANHRTKRFAAVRKIRRYIDRIVELTGTPSPRGLIDLWAQAFLMDLGERLGRTITAFRQRWFAPPGWGQFKWRPHPFAETQITDQLKDIVLSMRAEDYLELPSVMYNYVRVEMTPEETKQYREMKRHYVLEIADKTITAVNAGVLFGKLLQLSNGAVYTDDMGNWTETHTHKVDALLEILETVGCPTLVVYNYKSDLARIRAALRTTKLKFKEIREKGAEKDWDDGKLDVMPLHPASAGHGLNLHKSGSTCLIFFGLNPSLELYQQVLARLTGGHRRRAGIVAHHIVCDNTQDDVVIDILQDYGDQQERMMNAMTDLIEEELAA